MLKGADWCDNKHKGVTGVMMSTRVFTGVTISIRVSLVTGVTTSTRVSLV